ncbi:MAG TPA: hypothetical protein PLB01_06540 [Thermoanaerobaculia bacterium]|nr:hypothetical protein [Thermoanaerobaculia bacterium]
MPETGAPAPRTRSAPAAFGRGVSQVVANPGLLLAPLAFGGIVAASIVAAAFVAAFWFGRAFASAARMAERGPGALSDLLEGLRGLLFAAPGAVVLALLAVLVGLLLLTALAAWIRAGVTGSLAEIDRRAGEGAPLSAFRHPMLGPLFFGSAGRLFGGFFALVNLYALVASFAVLLIVLPLVGAFVAVEAGRSGLVVLFALLFVVLALVGIVASAALRVVYLVAGRVLAIEGLDALAAAGRAIALVRASPGRAATLYLLTVGGAMAVGLAFVFPRIVLTFAAGWTDAGAWAPVLVSGAFILLQMGAGFAYDLSVTGAFVALWPADEAKEPPLP